MHKQPYKLDRSIVNAQSFEEANDHSTYWNAKTENERLNAACFIINQIFGVTPETKVDRTVITRRKQP